MGHVVVNRVVEVLVEMGRTGMRMLGRACRGAA